jgi:hypothetical protein
VGDDLPAVACLLAEVPLAADPQARLNALASAASGMSLVQGPASANPVRTEALAAKRREAALRQVDQELTREGLLGRDGQASPEAKDRYSFSAKSSLPTPGVLVKGCLDDCSICEPELQQAMQLELKRKELENKLLERQIQLLDKSQEYRCCPAGAAEDEGDSG